MTRKQYAVHTVRDEPVRLRDQLDHIGAGGGTVVSVIWQPARHPMGTLSCAAGRDATCNSAGPSCTC